LIEGTLGELSLFHSTFGYFADGVSPDTAVLAKGWEERMVALRNPNTGGATGWCLEPHDMAISKLAARREKDLQFVRALLKHKMIRLSRLQELMASFADPALRGRLAEALALCRLD
jgi:hypothetical protein